MYSQIQKGSKGGVVEELQKSLNQYGYNLSVDGDFGDKTLAAVRDFQTKNGLAVDGIVGSKTWGALLDTKTAKGANTTTSNKFEYDAFTNNPYTESDAVTNAGNALNTHLTQKPGEYTSQWQSQLDDTINKILNREKFSYDLNGDALYQQYKDKYIQQGKMAMGDAIGQASAMTGGYGNSYAQSVGQQAYQAQLQNLNDIVPELYQMAYDKYNQEGQDLYNQYAMLGDRENMDYSRYRDSMSDWLTERDYLAGRYDSERDYDYSKYVNDRDFAYGQYSDNRNLAYTEYRNAIEDEYQKDRDKVADEQWQKMYDAQYGGKYGSVADNTPSYSGKTSSGTNYNNGGLSKGQIKELQAALGVEADGYFGPKSKEAAGGLSAAEAYAEFVGGATTEETNGNKTSKSLKDVVSNATNAIKTTLGLDSVSKFKNSLTPESQHDAIARKMYGPYTAYVAVQIAKNKDLTDEEKAYLITYYGVTESDLQYARDKGYNID